MRWVQRLGVQVVGTSVVLGLQMLMQMFGGVHGLGTNVWGAEDVGGSAGVPMPTFGVLRMWVQVLGCQCQCLGC